MQPVIAIFANCNNGSGRQKKTCASAQAGVILVINPKVDFTYQYLWDPNSSNPLSSPTSEQSQQRIAKCKQRCELSFPGIILRSPVGNYFTGNANLHHNYINLKRPGLESAALSRTITGM